MRIILAQLTLILIAGFPTQNPRTIDKWIGTWKMNPLKSTLDPGVPPPTRIQKLEYVADGLKISDDKVDFHANETKLEYTVPLDGKTVPFPQIPGASVNFDRKDDNNFYIVVKANSATMTATVVTLYTVSEDGQSMTMSQVTSQRKREANGTVKETKVRLVFDKRP